MKKPTKKSLLGKKSKKRILTGIELLSSKGYKASFKSLAQIVSKRMNLNFYMDKVGSSFTSFDKDGNPIMNIDLWTYEDKAFDTSHYHIIAKALIYHESGHLLYSDFNIIGQLHQDFCDAKKEVEKAANDYHSAKEEDKADLIPLVREKVGDFVFKVNMPEVNNIYEDLSVDRCMCEKGREENGCLTFLRDIGHDKQKELFRQAIESGYVCLDMDNWDDNTLRAVLFEAQAFGHVGYRKHIDIQGLNALFEDDDIEKIKNLALYARFEAPTTYERAATAKALLNLCQPLLDKIADNLTNEYLYNIDHAKEMMEKMAKEAESHSKSTGSVDSEVVKSMGGGGTARGGAKMKSSAPSKYDLGLPEDLKKEMEESAKELGKESLKDEADSKSDESAAPERTKPTAKELEDEAINSMSEALDGASKTFEKTEDRAEKASITSDEDERAGETACHHSVSVSMIDLEDSLSMKEEYTSEGKEALKMIKKDELSSSVNELSKKMKKILMHRSQDDISKGRFEGSIDMSGLYRIKTDLQVFKKETSGEKKKVRFIILVDESGSMRGSKMENAIVGCWMVAKAAQKLKIPFAVYGHDEDFSSEVFRIRKYISFQNCRKLQALDNLFHIKAHDNNRDGLAIFHSLRELVKSSQPDEDLYFFILSDGEPAAAQYSGASAIEDMQKIMNTFKKHYQVHSVGIGLGNFDFDSIRQIYENSVCVKNPQNLPNEMFKVFKKMLKL